MPSPSWASRRAFLIELLLGSAGLLFAALWVSPVARRPSRELLASSLALSASSGRVPRGPRSLPRQVHHGLCRALPVYHWLGHSALPHERAPLGALWRASSPSSSWALRRASSLGSGGLRVNVLRVSGSLSEFFASSLRCGGASVRPPLWGWPYRPRADSGIGSSPFRSPAPTRWVLHASRPDLHEHLHAPPRVIFVFVSLSSQSFVSLSLSMPFPMAGRDGGDLCQTQSVFDQSVSFMASVGMASHSDARHL